MVSCCRWSLVACVVVAAEAAQAQQLQSLLPTQAQVRRYGLVRRWYAVAPVDGLREQIRTATLAGDQLHLQTDASRIHVLDAETGQWVWSAQIGLPLPNHFGSAYNADSVFAISGSRLYRLNRDDGTLVWTIRLPGVPNAAPAADETKVVVSTAEGMVLVYDVETHEKLWFYQTNGPVSIPALLLDEKVACASEDGLMYVFPDKNELRQAIFRYQTRAPVSAAMNFWGRRILVASQDSMLYAVDIRTGETYWPYSATGPIRQPVVVIDKQVFVTPDDAGLHVVNVETGELLWRYNHARRFVAASDKRVYAADKYGQVVILERKSGRFLGLWDTHNFDFRVRNEQNDRIYLVSRKGLVVCLHEREHEKPLRHEKLLPPTGEEPGGAPPTKPSEQAAR